MRAHRHHSTHLALGLCLGLAGALGAPATQTAQACSPPAGTSVEQVAPDEGEAMGPAGRIFLEVSGGELAAEDVALVDANGQDVPVAVVESWRRWVFAEVIAFESVSPLAPGSYTITYSYQGSEGTDEQKSYTFEIDADATLQTSLELDVEWSKLTTEEEIRGDTCSSGFIEEHQLVVSLPGYQGEAEDVFVGVSFEGADGASVARHMLLASSQDASLPLRDRIEIAQTTECVTLTPFHASGATGNPQTICQPDRCQTIAGLDEYDYQMIESLPSCGGAEADDEGLCQFTGAQAPASAPGALGLLALLGLLGLRRRER